MTVVLSERPPGRGYRWPGRTGFLDPPNGLRGDAIARDEHDRDPQSESYVKRRQPMLHLLQALESLGEDGL